MWMALLMLVQAATGPQLTGDFDRDGIEDRAWFVSGPGRVDLLMQSGGGDAAPVTVISMADPADRRFWVAEPGRYRTACGPVAAQGDDRCRQDHLVLSGPTIAFGGQDDRMTALVWDGTAFKPIDLMR